MTKACDRSCKYWTFDMDGAYCIHPKSLEIAPVFYASVNRMSLEGYCKSGWDNKEENSLALWEPR